MTSLETHKPLEVCRLPMMTIEQIICKCRRCWLTFNWNKIWAYGNWLTLISIVKIFRLATAFFNYASSFSRFTLLFFLQLFGSFLTQQELYDNNKHVHECVEIVWIFDAHARCSHPKFLLSFRSHKTFLRLLSRSSLFQPLSHLSFFAVLFLLFRLSRLIVPSIKLVNGLQGNK